jgi:hypothetical protein
MFSTTKSAKENIISKIKFTRCIGRRVRAIRVKDRRFRVFGRTGNAVLLLCVSVAYGITPVQLPNAMTFPMSSYGSGTQHAHQSIHSSPHFSIIIRDVTYDFAEHAAIYVKVSGTTLTLQSRSKVQCLLQQVTVYRRPLGSPPGSTLTAPSSLTVTPPK